MGSLHGTDGNDDVIAQGFDDVIYQRLIENRFLSLELCSV